MLSYNMQNFLLLPSYLVSTFRWWWAVSVVLLFSMYRLM